jgi:fluoroquinolone transport system ATP-binding protein
VKVEYVANDDLKTAEFPLENLGENEEFLRILKEHEILRINTEEPTLEDIFLRVTGRRLV